MPHITDAIQEWIERVAMIPVDGMEGPADVCIIELGGTIGKSDFQVLWFANSRDYEAFRFFFCGLHTPGIMKHLVFYVMRKMMLLLQGTLNPCHSLKL